MDGATDKWLVVVNPKASIGKCGKDWPEIQRLLTDEGIDFDAVLTEHPRHAIDLVRDLVTEKGYRKVAAVGGDGTNNEVINGLFTQQRIPTREIKMGILPVGTGNDWRRTFGFTVDYRENIGVLKREQVFLHDVGKVTYYNDGDPRERYFLNGAGTGLDEMVCNKTNRMKSQGKGGTVRYLMSVISSFFSYKSPHVRVEVDGELVFDDTILSLSVGNGRYNGGGMMMMPNAVPNDGRFDLTVIKRISLLKFAANVGHLYDGTFVDRLKEVSLFQGSRLRITSLPSHHLLLETEGETLTNSPFDFEMLPQAIQMVVPNPSLF